MNSSPDVLAYSNPALTAVVIFSYVQGYRFRSDSDPHFALAFLVIPIAMSRELASSFEGTTARTGLRLWLDRTPGIRLDFADHVRDTERITRHGLLFGLQRSILRLSSDGLLTSHANFLKRVPRDPAGVGIAERPLTVARRFGEWCGLLPSVNAIFASLGVAP